MYHSRVVIILLSTGLYKSHYLPILLVKIGFRLTFFEIELMNNKPS